MERYPVDQYTNDFFSRFTPEQRDELEREMNRSYENDFFFDTMAEYLDGYDENRGVKKDNQSGIFN